MKHWLLGISLICFGSTANATWQGKLDLTPEIFAYGAKSFTGYEQVGGLQKSLWGLFNDGRQEFSVGLYVAANTKSVYFGPTIIFPGGGLDRLITIVNNWQQLPASVLNAREYLSRFKTGISLGYNASNLAKAHARPDFFGYQVGYTVPVGK